MESGELNVQNELISNLNILLIVCIPCAMQFSWICIHLSVFYHLTLCLLHSWITLKCCISRSRSLVALHCLCYSCVYMKNHFNNSEHSHGECLHFVLIHGVKLIFRPFFCNSTIYLHLATENKIERTYYWINCLFYAVDNTNKQKFCYRILMFRSNEWQIERK